MDRNALAYLADMNRNMEAALALLAKLAENPELNHEEFLIYHVHLREYLGYANIAVFEALEKSEEKTMMIAYRERLAYEKKIADPDDCYFSVRHREEELRRQGKPSKLGLAFGEVETNEDDDAEDGELEAGP